MMIEKITLRDQVKTYLQQEMLNSNIKFGQNMSLAEISRNIDVSVTPIREALAQLEQAGLVTTIANKGFFLPPLSIKEAMDIYPIIINLEQMAIHDSKFSEKQLEQLRKVQSDFESASSERNCVKLDLLFHETLLQNFQNKVAKRILSDLKMRVFFYELEYMKATLNHQNSAQHHWEIVEFLAGNQILEAAEKLKDNWEVSLQFLLETAPTALRALD